MEKDPDDPQPAKGGYTNGILLISYTAQVQEQKQKIMCKTLGHYRY